MYDAYIKYSFCQTVSHARPSAREINSLPIDKNFQGKTSEENVILINNK